MATEPRPHQTGKRTAASSTDAQSLSLEALARWRLGASSRARCQLAGTAAALGDKCGCHDHYAGLRYRSANWRELSTPMAPLGRTSPFAGRSLSGGTTVVVKARIIKVRRHLVRLRGVGRRADEDRAVQPGWLDGEGAYSALAGTDLSTPGASPTRRPWQTFR